MSTSEIYFWDEGHDLASGSNEKTGISSNMMTYFKIVRNQMGITFLIVPIVMKDLSLL